MVRREFEPKAYKLVDGKLSLVITTAVVSLPRIILVLSLLVLVLPIIFPLASADYGSQYGNAPCGYSVRYYSYYYPYVYTSMMKKHLAFIYYSYPEYYPNPTYQLTVTSNPSGLPVTGSGQFCKSQSATISVTSSTIDLGSGTRYVFTGWSGDYSGSGSSGQVIMTASKNVVANFKTQYLLNVQSPYGSPSGSGWYDAQTNAYASLGATVVDLAAGARVEFRGWNGDAVGQSVPVTIQMTGPKTVTAQWIHQYYVSVSSQYGQSTGSGWYDEGSTATLNVNSPIPAGYGSQYVFQKWTGTNDIATSTAQVRVDKAMAFEANWQLDQTQLYVTSAAVGIVIVIGALAIWLGIFKRTPHKQDSKPMRD
jgi:uncharacterized repeat protein (TIGR02543 family)